METKKPDITTHDGPVQTAGIDESVEAAVEDGIEAAADNIDAENAGNAIDAAVLEEASEFEETKKNRTLGKKLNMFVSVLLVGLGFFHLYVGFFGARSAMDLRATHWLIISAVVFIMYPFTKRTIEKVTVFDWIWFALAVASTGYILLNWQNIANRAGVVQNIDIFFGIICTLVVLEAGRRSMGLVLPLVASVFLAYGFLGQFIPGVLGHRGYSVTRIFSFLYTGTEGIFGVAMDVSAKYVALFVLFGAVLELFGGGELFVDLAYAITGKTRGGPAKAAVVSSALMGTMSGSAVANVVTTGAFTIPLMKKNGYKPQVAGAIEAVASTGGQILPPVMGAAAFLMAEMTGIGYAEICIAAALPALLYFFSCFMMVDLEAAKENIQAPSDDQIKPVWHILKTRGYLILPLALLITMIVMGYSAILAASYSIVLILVLDLIFNKERKTMPRRFLKALNKGMRSVVSVACACACAGIIVGIIQLTGLGAKFSSLMLAVAGDNIFIALIMTMLASLVLGCGLPTTASYMILAVLAVPALVKMGVPLISAHLFVFYFGCISTITPPVALSAYAGAALAGANPNKVGYTAFRFGIVAFIVPYMFVYQPSLLLQGGLLSIIQTIITALFGVVMLAVGVQGWLLEKANPLERILAIAAGLLMIDPGWLTDIIGIACAVVIIVMQVAKRRAKKAKAT